MIGLDLKGRLGNQLFRYAFIRAIINDRQKLGISDAIEISDNDFYNLSPKDGWEDSLKYFNVLDYNSLHSKLIYNNTKLFDRILLKSYYAVGRIGKFLGRRIQLFVQHPFTVILSHKGYFVSLDNKYKFSNISKLESIRVDGSFENPIYFDSIRDILLQEFQPQLDRLAHNQQLYNIIESTNSVCISIRRGDYVTNSKFKGIYNVCTPNYFASAVKIIKEKIPNAVFIIFSDDINWAKSWAEKNIFDSEYYLEKGDDPVWEKLRLMYSCKHFIISNSSFSWWASYLGREPDKVVVSPSRWYNDNRPSYLILKDFIKVELD